MAAPISSLSDVFSLFCTDDLHPALLKPFKIEGYTYATDNYTLVRCENEKIDFEYENLEPFPNINNSIPKINTSEIVNIDSIDWLSLMNTDETIGDGKDIECGHCKGLGIREGNDYYKNRFHHYEYECPVCDGSGCEEEQKQIPTGRKTFSNNDIVNFKDISFHATKFYKLKMIKDFIGSEVELTSYNGNLTGALFKIGFLEVLIMPCFYHEQNVIATVSVIDRSGDYDFEWHFKGKERRGG